MEYSQPIKALEELEARFVEPTERKVVWNVGPEGTPVPAWTLDQRRGSYTVVKSQVPAGCKFPMHFHDQTEHLIVYEGEAVVSLEGGKTHRLQSGDHVVVPPGANHEFEAIHETWVLVVTIPHSEAFAK